MSTFAVDPQALAALAEVLGTLRDELESLSEVDLTADFPRGDTDSSTQSLMLNWRHERLSLAGSMDSLKAQVLVVAEGYAAAEADVSQALTGAGPSS